MRAKNGARWRQTLSDSDPRCASHSLSVASLSAGWQAALLASRVILYNEAKECRWGVTIGRSSQKI